MRTEQTFLAWLSGQLEVGDDDIRSMRLDVAFELLVSRCEAARRRGAKDPVTTVSTKRAGGNSRRCTKRMLEHLGYTPAERRAVHRLFAGSASGWPGLLRLYAAGRDLSGRERQYARRQLNAFSPERSKR